MRVNAKLVSAVALLWSGVAWADINLPFEPPPSPQSRTVEIAEGGRIDIPLTLAGAPRGRTLDFIVRSPPTKGRLDPVRNSVAGDSAQVTYTHNPALGGGRDQFTFAVQRTSGGISASATIDIRIVENPPRLLVLPAALDFGPAPLDGAPRRAQFSLSNQGGGVALGRIAMQAPWRIEGDDSYRLTRGQRKTFSVLFQPPRASLFEGEVRFGASYDQILRLTGSGLAPEPVATPEPAPAPTAPVPSVPGRLPADDTAAPTPSPTPAANAANTPTPTPLPAGKDPDDSGPFGEELLLPNHPGGAVPLRDFRLLREDSGTVLASWLAPLPTDEAGGAYRIEQRELSLDAERRLRARWLPLKLTAAPTLAEGRRVLRLAGLPAGNAITLRAVLQENDGAPRGFSAFTSVDLPARPRRWLSYGGVGLLVVAALTAWWWWKRRGSRP